MHVPIKTALKCLVNCGLVLGVLLPTPLVAGGSALLIEDPHAGYALALADSAAWAHEISYSPGITSKLCIERLEPEVLICIQSLSKPIAAQDVAALARGFFKGIAANFDNSKTLSLQPVSFGELEGFGAEFLLPDTVQVSGRRQVDLFGGVNQQQEPVLAVAFSTPAQAAASRQQFVHVLHSLVYKARR